MILHKNKRGEEQLFMYIFYVILIIFILVILVLFVSNTVKKEDFKKQFIVKQVALILDSAKPGTNLIINQGNISIDHIKKKVIVEAKIPFSYDFFNSHKINIEELTGKVIVEVNE